MSNKISSKNDTAYIIREGDSIKGGLITEPAPPRPSHPPKGQSPLSKWKVRAAKGLLNKKASHLPR